MPQMARCACQKDHDELKALLDAFVMEKAVYELGYKLDNWWEWVSCLSIASHMFSDSELSVMS
jgi:predicted trehalose synthase